jgi:hypothetical protein
VSCWQASAVIASEAKQSSRAVEKILDCFVAFAPRNDDGAGVCLCAERQSSYSIEMSLPV